MNNSAESAIPQDSTQPAFNLPQREDIFVHPEPTQESQTRRQTNAEPQQSDEGYEDDLPPADRFAEDEDFKRRTFALDLPEGYEDFGNNATIEKVRQMNEQLVRRGDPMSPRYASMHLEATIRAIEKEVSAKDSLRVDTDRKAAVTARKWLQQEAPTDTAIAILQREVKEKIFDTIQDKRTRDHLSQQLLGSNSTVRDSVLLLFKNLGIKPNEESTAINVIHSDNTSIEQVEKMHEAYERDVAHGKRKRDPTIDAAVVAKYRKHGLIR